MTADRVPLFCDTALAERIERVGAQLIAGEGSPFDKVAGLGVAGVPSPAALDEIERASPARGAPVQMELAHLVDPAIRAPPDRGRARRRRPPRRLNHARSGPDPRQITVHPTEGEGKPHA